jgi:hypothetical protein
MHFSAIGNSTRMPATMSWHGANMMLEGIAHYVDWYTEANREQPDDSDFDADSLQMHLDTAESELQHLRAWMMHFSGYPEESWRLGFEQVALQILQGRRQAAGEPPLSDSDIARIYAE